MTATYTPSVASALGNASKTYSTSDADFQNCVNYLIWKHTDKGSAPLTAMQALAAWQNDVVRQLREQTKQWLDQQQAQQINNPTPVFT